MKKFRHTRQLYQASIVFTDEAGMWTEKHRGEYFRSKVVAWFDSFIRGVINYGSSFSIELEARSAGSLAREKILGIQFAKEFAKEFA